MIAFVLVALVLVVFYQPSLVPNLGLQNMTSHILPQKFSIANIMAVVKNPQSILGGIGTPQETSIAESKQALDYINDLRVKNGQKMISFDQRVFNVAMARAKDNYDYGYFDHTNPKTGTCAWSIKSQYGLSQNEDVAENLYMEAYGTAPALTNPDPKSAVDAWMTDFGHKHDLLFPDHVSGAFACYGGVCAFEGLNYEGFGSGCHTAAEGKAQFGKLDGCSQVQVDQYLALERKLDELKPQVQGMPSVASSQQQYDYYNGLANQYNGLVSQINSFTCS